MACGFTLWSVLQRGPSGHFHNSVVDGRTGLTSDGFVDQDHVCVFTLTVSTDFSKLAAVIGHGFFCQQASLSLLLSASDLNKPHTTH